MDTVAIEREVERAERGSAGETGVADETERSRREQLLLRAMRWSMAHPQTGYPRFILKVSLIAYRLGLGRFDNDMTLTTVGRKSREPRHVVLSAIRVDGHLYTVNPFGERAHWYRNLLADPVVTVQRRGRTWSARAARLTDHDEAWRLFAHASGEDALSMRWMLRVHGLPETADGFAENIESLHYVRFDPIEEPGPAPMRADLEWIWPVAGTVGLFAGVTRRSLTRGIGAAVVAFVAVLAGALGWGAAFRQFEVHGTHPEGRWARLFAWAGPRLTWWLYDAFDQALDLQPEDDVLDVACGGGTFLRARARIAHRVAGIDHSETLIDMARHDDVGRVAAGIAEYAVGDVTELPWDDGTFSVVTSNDVGCYEAKARVAIEEMYRVLRSGGRAVLEGDRRDQMEAAGFTEVEVEPMLRFGRITRGVKP